MDDVLVPAPPGNARNGPYRIVKEVVGRSEDAPVFRNEDGREDWIHPIVLVEFYVKGLKAFQVRVIDKTSFRFLAVLDAGADWDAFVRDATARLRALLAEKRMANVTFQLEQVTRLENDPRSGKFRLIVPLDRQ
jgi:phenylacetate-CoA ligase